jgi:hypothetical protein
VRAVLTQVWENLRSLSALSNQFADSYNSNRKCDCCVTDMKMHMRVEFHNKQEIILLHKGSCNDFDLIRGYNAHTNVVINNRCTAMITRVTTK